MKKIVKIRFYLIFFSVTSCGFASGLYKDILQAQDYVSSQKYIDAAKIYEETLLKKPPKNIRLKVHFQLGEIYSLYLGNYAKALSHFQEIIDDEPDLLWLVKATEKVCSINLNQIKDYLKSINCYESLIAFKPELENINLYKFETANAHFELKEFDKAKKIFTQLTKLVKTDYPIDAYYMLGIINFYEKNTDGAIENWFEFLKREKRKDKIVQVKFLIANAYESNEKLKEAYNIYYSILGDYPNPEVIKERLDSIYQRRIARKR